MNLRILLFLVFSFFLVLGLQAQSPECVSSEVSVSVAQKPVVTITGSTTVCTNGNAVLIADLKYGIGAACSISWEFSDDSIQWQTLPFSQNKSILQLASLTRTSNYRAVYVCGGAGCDSKPSNTQKITVVDKPIVTLTPSTLFICENTPVSLTANVQGGTGSDVYSWEMSTDGINFKTIAGATASVYTVSNLTSNTYFRCNVIEPGDACSGTSRAVLINVDGCRGSIGDFVWLDCNKNGLQDAGEVGLDGVPVALSGTATDGTIISQTTATIGGGLYTFNNLKPGTYAVTFGQPAGIKGLIFTPKNRGNFTVDSDVDATGKSGNIVLAPSQNNTTIDAGYIDNEAPVFSKTPTDITIECGDPIIFASLTAFDNVSKTPIVNYSDESSSLACPFKTKYTRTWKADDGCGNIATIKQNISVQDTRPPVFNKTPADITVSCDALLPSGSDVIATDACEGKVGVLLSQQTERVNGVGIRLIKRIFLAKDACGNEATVSNHINVIDTSAPQLVGLPPDVTLACGVALPDVPTVTAKDNCDDAAFVTRDADEKIPGSCSGNYKIIRHWTATDDAGNARKGQQVITVFDTEAPTIANVPTDVTVDCKNIPPAVALVVKDNCDCKDKACLVPTTPTDKIIAGNCASNYTIVRTWTATDACGNTTTKTQNIKVEDKQAPVLAQVPSDITVNVGLGEVIPPVPTNITTTDNCDGLPKIIFTESPQVVTGNCRNTLIRTWQATDVCGNKSDVQTQTITIRDTVTVSIAASKTQVCFGDTFKIIANVQPAGGVYKYVWETSVSGTNWVNIPGATTAVLEAKLNTRAQFRVTAGRDKACLVSTEAVTLNTLDCKGNIGNFVWLDCNKNGIQDAGEKGIAGVGVALSGTADDGTTLQLSTATDANGFYSFSNVKSGKYSIIFTAPNGARGWNFTTKNAGSGSNDSKADATGQTAVFTLAPSKNVDNIDAGFIDDEKPTFAFLPQDKTMACGETLAFDAVEANDNFSNLLRLDSTNVTSKGVCPNKFISTRTWNATDGCGNIATVAQKISLIDKTAPILGAVPADITVDCSQIPPPPQNVSATDNCDAVVKINFTQQRQTQCRNTYTITRTWSAVDSCGNVSTPKSQTITVQDIIKPTLVRVPNDITVNIANGETIPTVPTDVFASDNCDNNPSIVFTEETPITSGNCTSLIKRTWTATDNCGNFATRTQTITLIDAVKNATVVSNTPEHCTTSNGTVLFTPVTYSYAWSDGGSGNSRNNLKAGDYTVTVSKNASCTIVQKIILGRECTNNCVAPLLSVQTTNPTCGKTDDGKAIVAIANGRIADYNFFWTPNVSSTNAAVSLKVGEYKVRVVKANDPTCFDSLRFVISAPQNVAVNAPLVENATCTTPTGSAQFVTSDTAIYTFKWSDGDTHRLRKNMLIGNYTVTVSRLGYCDAVHNVSISNNCVDTCTHPSINIVVQNQSCDPKNTGSAVISIANGNTNNFELRITNEALQNIPFSNRNSTFVVENLKVGNYKVRLTKSTDITCYTDTSFAVKASENINISEPQITAASCTSQTGSISIAVGNTNNYEVRITNNASQTFPYVIRNSSFIIENLVTGSYKVIVSDKNNVLCAQVFDVVIPNNNPLKTTAVINSQPSCNQSNGYVTLNTSGGSGQYTYSWGEGNSRFVLPAGVTMVTCTDRQTGCQTTVSFTLVNQNVEATVVMDTVLNVSCYNNKDARLNYTIKTGAGFVLPMTVEIRDNQNRLYSNGALGAGNYVLVVSDATGCVATKRTFKVQEPDPILLQAMKHNQTCDSPGSITVKVQGGNNNYEFSVQSGEGKFVYSSLSKLNAQLSNIKAGIYSITASDSRDNVCSTTTSNIIIKDSCLCRLPLVDSVATKPAICGLLNGTATIVLKNNATNLYQYDWSPLVGTANAVGNSRMNMSGGVYNVLISSATNSDCFSNVTVGVGSLEGPKNIKYTTSPARCNASNGSVALLPAPADSLTYTWLFDGSNAALRNDLKAGYYQVLVTKNTLPTCPTLINVKVESVNPLVLESVVTLPASCGQNNGKAVVTVAHSESNNYQLSVLSEGQLFLDTLVTRQLLLGTLKAGTYSMNATEIVSGCQAVNSFTMTNQLQGMATINLADSVIYTRCFDSKDAQLDYQIRYDANFVLPATVKITDAQGITFSSDKLAPGNYCLVVRDGNNCVAGSACFVVKSPAAVQLLVSETNRTCDKPGSFNFKISGGSNSYKLRVESSNGEIFYPNPSTNNYELSSLNVGAYTATASDSKGCTVIIDTLNIRNECATPPPCNLKTDFSTIHKNCNNAGSIKINILSGVAPYVFDWLDIPGTNNPQNRADLKEGKYTIVITDALNCKDTIKDITILNNCITPQPCTPPQFGNVSVVEARCNTATGSISIAKNDADDAELGITNDATQNIIYIIRNSQFVIENLIAGSYKLRLAHRADTTCFTEMTVVVRNQDGAVIAQPSIQAASCTAPNGSVEFSGNDAAYNYIWSDTKTGAKRSDLTAGIYTITVTDQTNAVCKQVLSVNVPSLNSLTATSTILQQPSCGASDGQVKLKTNTNNGAWRIESGGIVSLPFSTFNAQLSALKSGIYKATITDNTTGCAATTNFVLTNAIAGISEVQIASKIIYTSCAASHDAAVNFSLKNSPSFVAPARVVITSTQGSVVSKDSLGEGNYIINVFDGNNCLAGSESFEVKSPQPIKLNIAVAAQTCTAVGTIKVSVAGGSGSYRLSLVSSLPNVNFRSDTVITNNASLITLKAGAYVAIVTDSRGCSVTQTHIVVPNDSINCSTCPKLATVFVTNSTCGANGSIRVNTIGGVAPYVFDWADVNGSVNSQNRDNLKTGSYSLTITDASGCTDSLKNIIVRDTCPITQNHCTLKATVASIKNKDCTSGGAINISLTGSTQAVTYIWSDTSLNVATRTNLAARAYTIIVRDALGCADTLRNIVVKDSCSTTVITPQRKYLDTLMYVSKSITLCFNGTTNGALITSACPQRYRSMVGYNINDSTHCVQLTGLSEGRDTLCFSICRNGLCDTLSVYVVVKAFVTPQDTTCSKLYDGPITLYTLCGKKATLCTQLEIQDTINYRIYDNGRLISSGFDFCKADTSVSYSYFPLLLNRPSGGWHLDEWVIGGKVHQAEFYKVQDIVDSMNVWNPGGQWRLDAATFTIFSLNNPYKYSAMLWSRLGEPIAEMEPNTHLKFSKIALPLEVGAHTIVLQNTTRRCADTVNVIVRCQGKLAGDVETQHALSLPVDSVGLKNKNELATTGGHPISSISQFPTSNFPSNIVVYNAFSPNQDGINDTFIIEGLDKYPNSVLSVYNRWGNEVFSMKNYDNNWAGTYQNAALPEGTYFWMIELQNKQVKAGILQIQR